MECDNVDIEQDYEQDEFNSTLNEETENADVKYEITENIRDTANNITKLPIDINFMLAVPLNNVSNIFSNNNTIDITNTTYTKEELSENPRTKYISILHIKADFDDHNRLQFLKPIADAVNPIKIVNNLQEYINGVKVGINSGINGVGAGNTGDKIVYIPNVIAGPVVFLNKLQRRTIGFAERFRDAFFGK